MQNISLKTEQKSFDSRNKELEAIIQPIATTKYTSTLHWSWIKEWIKNKEAEDGVFNMNPDYQRGHVWTEQQQRNFIEAVYRGKIPQSLLSIRFNSPLYDDEVAHAWFNKGEWISDLPREIQLVDGKQRLTSILKFINNELAIFTGLYARDFEKSYFDARSYVIETNIFSFTSKADLLKFYLDLNDGGTPHTQEELDQVRIILSDLKKEQAA